MKYFFKMPAMLFAIAIFTISATICSAQAGKMVGGYSKISNADETAAQAAAFAVETQAQKDDTLELISVENAERQVVAGSNYRLCLAIKSGEKSSQASAVVYLNLQNKFSLTSWKAGTCSETKTEEPADAESEASTFLGKLEVGKTESVILYVGEETGDYAAYCFANNSAAGRAILKACKNGEQCEVTGEADYESACKVKGLEATLSASGKITKVESVKSLAAKTTAASKNAAAPDEIVKNLYAAQKNPKTAPFFQTTNRAAVDKFFAADLADLIWDDTVKANGEVGTIDGDPLYNAQDMKITAFVIGKPEYTDDIATVLVSFKNFGKADTVKFMFEQQEDKTWKIMDIVYKNGDMLKGMLFDAKIAAESK